MKRARRSVVSALRASFKQHSAKRSNWLAKVALMRANNADVSNKFRRAAFGGAAAARSGEVTDWRTKQTSFLRVESVGLPPMPWRRSWVLWRGRASGRQAAFGTR